MPLFHQPGKQGYYAPLLGSGSTTRLNAFRNVGRFVLLTYCCNRLLKSQNQLDLLLQITVILLELVVGLSIIDYASIQYYNIFNASFFL